MSKIKIVLFCAALGLIGCGNDNIITMSFSGKSNFVSLIISDKTLKHPVCITGDSLKEPGAVFFETSKRKIYLQGKPYKILSTKNHFEGQWKLDGRTVVISFIKDSGKYNFSLRATPDSDILKWGMNVSAKNDEYFTGLFERVVDGDQKESWKAGIHDAMNLYGKHIDMVIKPTLSLYCPFYISSKGYGLFIEGYWPGSYDFCKINPNTVTIEFEGCYLNGIIYTSDYPAKIVQAHSLHVGPAIIPPKWAFLPWRWRDNHTNCHAYYDKTPVKEPFNSMVAEDLLMMKSFNIPCGVYWIDRPWAKGQLGYNDFDWDSTRFPNALKMIQWIHRNDMKLLLWIAPWVAGNMKDEAEQKGYTQPIKSKQGGADSTNAASIDFTNPDACRWWQKNGIEKMLKQGIDGFKLDRSEEEYIENEKFILHNRRIAREVRNEYPVLYVKTVNESCRKILGDNFMLIPRAGYSGSSKYSGFWGGDIGSSPEGLRTAIIAVQRCAVIGFPIWGSDIGGYWQGKLDREICARWLAFGCFCPIMEFGPIEDHAPWDMTSEPHYDTSLIATWRLYAKIHTNLAEYSYKLAKEAHTTGMPIVRPLFLEYPEQKEAWKDWQTFTYGSDILISAIWKKGTNTHTCYLPAGTRWRDAWEPAKIYEGGQTIEICTPFYKIPIFLRENSTINLGNLNELYQESLKLANQKPDLQSLERKIQ